MDDLENVRAIYLFIYVVVVLLIQAKVTIIKGNALYDLYNRNLIDNAATKHSMGI